MALDKEKTLVAAQKFVDKDQHDKAIREFLKILDVEPNDGRVLLLLASSYERLGKNEDAAKTYLKVFENYRNEGAYQKALAILKQAQKCQPNSDDIAMNMAEIYSALGLPHESVLQLEKCLERAKAESNTRSYGRILQTMVRVDSENIQTRTRYAKWILENGDVDGACRQYALALAQLLSKERYVDYIQTSREYLKLKPKDPDVLHALAGIYIRMNRYHEALEMLGTMSPDDITPEIHEQFITCYTKMGMPSRALEQLKKLARAYEAQNSPQDLVESIWLRAQKINPNDPEVCAALGDDVPMLSESALNVVLSPEVQRERDAAQAAQAAQVAAASVNENSSFGRLLDSKYEEAIQAYRQGNTPTAKALCLQIIDSDEANLPALKLLVKIFEAEEDMTSLAQIERKIARAVYQTDLDEAIRHVLRAEKCTPRAWENFNLMLVFGLSPSDYGMSAPEASGHSNPRIPARQMASESPARPSAPPPLPRPNLPRSSAVPPIPPQRISRGTLDIPQPIRQIPGDVMRDLQNLEQHRTAMPVSGFASPYQIRPNAPGKPPVRPGYAVPPTPVSPTADAPQIGADVSEGLDDAFDALVGGTTRVPGLHQAPPAASPTPMPAWMTRSKANIPVTGAPSPVRPIAASPQRTFDGRHLGHPSSISSAQATPPSNVPVPPASGLRFPPNHTPAPYQPTAPHANGMRFPPNQTPAPYQPTAPHASGLRFPPNQAPAPYQTDDLPESQFPNMPTPTKQTIIPVDTPESVAPNAPASIPDAQRKRVEEALQEVEFYASLNLLDDARKLLNTLIGEFGDIDIIHETKLRLDAG